MREILSKICLLFDLDGTLVLTGGAGIRAFDRAFKEVFRAEGSIKAVTPAGRTDPEILRAVCRLVLNREPEPSEEKAVFERYLDHLTEEVRRAEQFKIMPGVVPLLEALSRNERCLPGLGTGNLKKGAEIKLRRPDLWRFFSFGGFGSDANDRPRLLEIARERGRDLLKDGESLVQTYVIGDTPNDIRSGHAIGARTVGVATGPYALDDLVKAGADLAYPDLSDYRTFMADLDL